MATTPISAKFGAEPKKVAVLAGLLAIAAIVFYMNSSGDPGGASPAASTPSPSLPPVTAPRNSPPVRPAASRSGRERVLQEFRPSMKPKRPEDRPDPMTIDPTLKLDTFAKLQQVSVDGMHRSLFDFGMAQAPKPDPAKEAAKPKVPMPFIGPKPAPPEVAKVEPPKPVAPPVPFKFFGYVNPTGQPQKRAFFIEGEEIHIVSEGDVVKRRYKIVRIGINSVVVEDTQFQSQQTLPLEEQPG